MNEYAKYEIIKVTSSSGIVKAIHNNGSYSLLFGEETLQSFKISRQ